MQGVQIYSKIILDANYQKEILKHAKQESFEGVTLNMTGGATI